MMLSGVAKSGSPISRWTMSRPWASSRRALASTSKAPSVPMWSMRSANLIGMGTALVDALGLAAIDHDRLAGQEARVVRAQERAHGAELGRVADAAHGNAGLDVALGVLLMADALLGGSSPVHLMQSVGEGA